MDKWGRIARVMSWMTNQHTLTHIICVVHVYNRMLDAGLRMRLEIRYSTQKIISFSVIIATDAGMMCMCEPAPVNGTLHSMTSLLSHGMHCYNLVLSTINVITSHKKFSEGKQTHVGMEALKTNQTRWKSMTPQHFHTIPTSCAILPPLTQICYVFAEKGCGRQ